MCLPHFVRHGSDLFLGTGLADATKDTYSYHTFLVRATWT